MDDDPKTGRSKAWQPIFIEVAGVVVAIAIVWIFRAVGQLLTAFGGRP